MRKNPIARILLSPFSLVYAAVISLRNVFYDAGLLRSTRFNIPVINIGNLSIGGTGKTPHVEYLIKLLEPYLNVATLSRGYKRKSKGFRFVRSSDNAMIAGDEPMQYKVKNPNIVVAVSESRNIGIPMILQYHIETQVILLDDAFQHRSVVPDLNILLTEFNNLYTEDYLLPVGRLRESQDAAKRADMVIVTKCPDSISEQKISKIKEDLSLRRNQQLYFSKYKYLNPYYIFDSEITINLEPNNRIILISAIANVDYLLHYLDNKCEVDNIIKYEDHHYFSELELEQFKKINENLSEDNSLFLTTEKDAMRLALHKDFLVSHKIPIFVLPIEVQFFDQQGRDFAQDVKDFLLDYTH